MRSAQLRRIANRVKGTLGDLTPVFGREHVRIEVGNPLLPFLGNAEIA